MSQHKKSKKSAQSSAKSSTKQSKAGNAISGASTFGVHRPVLDLMLFGLALLGILVVVHLLIQSGRGFDRGCFGFSEPAQVAATFNCEAVIQSESGKLFGVSNVIWGLFFYAGMAGLGFTVLRKTGVGLRRLKTVRALLLGGGVVYSAYLSYVQYFELGEFCKLCLISASIVMIMFITTVVEYFTKPGAESNGSRARDAATSPALIRRVPFFAALAVATLVIAGADFMYFNSLETSVAEEVLPVATGSLENATNGDPVGQCTYDDTKAKVENYLDMVSFSDPSMGNADADVVVIEFFDPNCPHCKTMHPLMQVLASDYGDKARFVFRPFVLGQHSMLQVQALHIAAQQGKFFEMLEAQFARQGTQSLSMNDMEEIAAEIGLDFDLLKTRLENQMYRSVTIRQRNVAYEAGVNSVPAVMINGRFVATASRTLDCLKTFIDEASAS